MISNTAMAQLLKQIRIEKKLSQSEIAQILEVDRSTISRLEKGLTEISLNKFLVLCELANIDVAEATRHLKKFL